jgi:hypothetical protein
MRVARIEDLGKILRQQEAPLRTVHGNTLCVSCGVRRERTDPHLVKIDPRDGKPRCFSCYQRIEVIS